MNEKASLLPKKSKEKAAVVQYNNKVWEPTIGYIGETKGGQRHGTVESFSKEERGTNFSSDDRIWKIRLS